MKHIENIDLRNKLEKVKGLKGFELNYAIKRNQQKLKAEIAPLTKMEKEIDDIKKPYDDEEKILKEEYSTVDGKVKYKTELIDGKPVQCFDVPERLKFYL